MLNLSSDASLATRTSKKFKKKKKKKKKNKHWLLDFVYLDWINFSIVYNFRILFVG